MMDSINLIKINKTKIKMDKFINSGTIKVWTTHILIKTNQIKTFLNKTLIKVIIIQIIKIMKNVIRTN